MEKSGFQWTKIQYAGPEKKEEAAENNMGYEKLMQKGNLIMPGI